MKPEQARREIRSAYLVEAVNDIVNVCIDLEDGVRKRVFPLAGNDRRTGTVWCQRGSDSLREES